MIVYDAHLNPVVLDEAIECGKLSRIDPLEEWKKTEEFLEMNKKLKEHSALFLHGFPGTGKSALIKKLAS